MRLTLATWDPGYGPTVDVDGPDQPSADIDVNVEVSAGQWSALQPAVWNVPGTVVFLDGVRRIDHGLYVVDDTGTAMPTQAVAASIAAGTVITRSYQPAVYGPLEIRRIVAGAAGIGPVVLNKELTYQPVPVAGPNPTAQGATNAIQQRLAHLETAVASALPSVGDSSTLVVLDGPLSARQHIPGAIGYVKTHQVAYLPATLEPVVATLDVGQRTPMFLISPKGNGWSRLSFYLRLTSAPSHPWDAVVRVELPADLPDPSQQADVAATVLPRYASTPLRDARAPQNLVPIGALEHHLRHRLGDQTLILRQFRRALGTSAHLAAP